jgi:crotonobetainyl-CoA:carnitine CoA-transferase CaiB-like acyl-CoA transferase
MTPQTPNTALHHIRVLDLTRLVPGGFCAQLLGDMGADVIKIESKKQSNPLGGKGRTPFFTCVNRNKRSLALDMKSDQAREIILKLVDTADVLVEDMRPAAAAGMGLDYRALHARNPRLIYCSLSGFGHTGPRRDTPGHEINFYALSGLLGITANKDGSPVVPGAQITAIGAGGFPSAFAITTALLAREHTGSGQHIDMALFDGTVMMMGLQAATYFAGGPMPAAQNTALNGMFPCYNIYKTADGRWMSMGGLEPQFWKIFCEKIERTDLMARAFDTSAITVVADAVKQKTMQEWIRIFADESACFEPVQSFEEVFYKDEQVRERGMIVDIDQQNGAPLKMLGNPVNLSETPWRASAPPPELGAHTSEILLDAGFDENAISHMKELGTIL